MKLFVDDVRACPDGWDLSRTISRSIRLLYSGEVDEISLDHDICHETGGTPGAFCSCPEDYGCIAFVVAMMPKHKRPKIVWLHSANPGGRDRMRSVLKEAGIDVRDRPVAHPWGDYTGPNISDATAGEERG